jgi:hypothetical protein
VIWVRGELGHTTTVDSGSEEPTYRRFGNAGKIGASGVVAVFAGTVRRESILTHLAL